MFGALAAAALLVYGAAASPLAGPALYVPLNALATALLLLAARRAGLRGPELGLGRREAAAGARLGALVTAMVAAGVVTVLALPPLRPLLEDARVAGAGWGLLAYRALVRIPLGTVLLEEVAFRGVLLAAWRRSWGTWPAVAGSSAVFGLWHVRPTLELLDANDVASGAAAAAAAVAGAVVLTTVGGAVFCWMRLRSGSLVAPMLAHAALNSLSLVAAYAVTSGAVPA